MNDIILKADILKMDDNELLTTYIIGSRAVPNLLTDIENELINRKYSGGYFSVGAETFIIDIQPEKLMRTTKINDIREIILHCIKNNIPDVFDNITIKQAWLDKQDWYYGKFYKKVDKETKVSKRIWLRKEKKGE